MGDDVKMADEGKMADITYDPIKKCNTCWRPERPGQPLGTCAGCKNEFYCSEFCSIADWSSHETVCSISTQPSATSNAIPVPATQPIAPEQAASPPAYPIMATKIKEPFKQLTLNKWLHDRPARAVYILLIDTYRMRMHDDVVYKLEVNVDSRYSQAGDGGEGGFRHFLQRVKSHPAGILPSWWSPVKVEECVQFGLSGDEWSSLARSINKNDILNHYENWMVPIQLRNFGDSIYTRVNVMWSIKTQFERDHQERSG
jgi:splicing suppressor protein 51